MQMSPQKRPRGRPALSADGTTQVTTKYPDELLDLVDAEIALRLDRPTQASMLRELVAEAIAARRKARGADQ